jgi:hypothetical protein
MKTPLKLTPQSWGQSASALIVEPRASAKLPQWHGIVVFGLTGLVIATSGSRAAERSQSISLRRPKIRVIFEGWALINNKEPKNCCFLTTRLGKNDGFRGRLVLLAVISLYLTARSAAAGLIGRAATSFSSQTLGGGVGEGAPIADRPRGMVTSRRRGA